MRKRSNQRSKLTKRKMRNAGIIREDQEYQESRKAQSDHAHLRQSEVGGVISLNDTDLINFSKK